MYVVAVTRTKAPLQAFLIHDFVNHEKYHENELPEGLTARYERIPAAIKNTIRLALDGQLHAYIIREERVSAALGIATIIRNVPIVKSEESVVLAHDLDYQLFNGADDIRHLKAARLIVRESAELAFKFGSAPVALGQERRDLVSEGADHNFVASIDHYDPHASRGFANISNMRRTDIAYGDLGEDPYGISKVGADIVMYYGHEILIRGA